MKKGFLLFLLLLLATALYPAAPNLMPMPEKVTLAEAGSA